MSMKRKSEHEGRGGKVVKRGSDNNDIRAGDKAESSPLSPEDNGGIIVVGGGVGGGGEGSGPVTNTTLTVIDKDLETTRVDATTEKDGGDVDKKCRIRSEHCGTLLFCGGTNWDLVGRRELPKGAKGAVGRNLWGPHRLRALSGIRVRKVVTGNSACHCVIITENNQVMTWGRNDKGQLGHGDLKRRDSPAYVEALRGFDAVDAACGRSHTLVLTDHGDLYSFGDNKVGQCGVGSQTSGVLVPSKVLYDGRPIAKMSCGAEFTMLLDVKGHIYSFGCPEYGQLGHNSDGRYFVNSTKLGYKCELVPRRVMLFIEKTREGHIIPMENVQILDIACGNSHTIALDSNKHCYTWGFGGYGRLGHAEPKDEMVPRFLKFFDGPNRGVQAVFAGGAFCMTISELGALYFWGQNKLAGEATMYPKPVIDLTGWHIKDVGCGNRSIVVLADDSVISWGSSPTYGELGYGDNKPKSSTTPKEVKSLDNIHVHKISCGFGHTLFLVQDDTEEARSVVNKIPEYSP